MADNASSAIGSHAIESVLVAIGGSPDAEGLVEAGHRLALALDRPFHAVHVETPQTGGQGDRPAADALAAAARLGGRVTRMSATTVVDGLCAHLEGAPAGIIVVGLREHKLPGRLWRRSLVEELRRRRPDIALHLIASTRVERPIPRKAPEAMLARYGLAASAVVLTLGVALLIDRLFGVRSLSLLFLFPVITAAARSGAGPALLASVLSAILFNVFFREPVYTLKLAAPQLWIMVTILGAVGVYTSILTAALRGRLALSDRSAKENSDIAAFAQTLTRVADWRSTADAVCGHVATMFGVNAIVLREVDGRLAIEGRAPGDADLSPLDWTAVNWAWAQGEPAGVGTAVLRDINWQFRPLKTSLGMLAVLGLARDDGRNPVAAEHEMLLSTLVAQAALAHERLRLEDLMREKAADAGDPA